MIDHIKLGLDELTPAQMAKLHEEYGAEPASLKQDAATLREWVAMQPHLPTLTGNFFIK